MPSLALRAGVGCRRQVVSYSEAVNRRSPRRVSAMSAQILDGEAAAGVVKAELVARILALRERGITPGLGTILVGDDGPSAKYIAMKHADAAELGMHSLDIRLPAEATQQEVFAAVDQLNDDPSIDAFIIQYPLPVGLDFAAAMTRMSPSKDADGQHPHNLGLLVMGEPAPIACTPAGIVRLLEHHGVAIAGRHVVIVGRGLTIGRPLANLLALKSPSGNAAVTVVHTGVDDIGAYTRTGDIVVMAAGSPGLLSAAMVQPGAAVVAAGVSFHDGRVVSDVADDVADVAGWISPRVGGVGPMTRAMLFANAVAAAEGTVA